MTRLDPLAPMASYEDVYGQPMGMEANGPTCPEGQEPPPRAPGALADPQARDELTRRPEDDFARRPLILSVADVAAERVEWLWRGRLPLGKLVTVDGDPGLGKTTVLLDIAARLTTGSAFPDSEPAKKGSLLMLTAEDGVGDTIRPRLEAAGANLKRCHVLDSVLVDGKPPRPWSLPGDIDLLEDAVRRTRATLVIIDPLMAFLHAGVNSWRDQDVRGALHPLSKAAEDLHCTIVLVRHLTKSGGPNALYRGGGSIGIIGAARAGLIFARDPDDESGSRCIVAVAKSNLGAPAPSMAYQLVPDEVRDCARTDWIGESVHTAASILSEPASEDERSARSEIEEVILNELANGPRAKVEVVKAVHAAGIVASDRTFRRAADKLGVRRRREGFGPGSVVHLELPNVRGTR